MLSVAVLGATGVVGQRLVQLLEHHPWFELVAVAASEGSVGKRYGDAAAWRLPTPVPERPARLVVQRPEPDLGATIVFSALDAAAAGPIEQAFAAAGCVVVSNASTHRLDPGVPLLVPEINPEQLDLVAGKTGFIVTNPNCATATLALALAPLHRAFGVESVCVTTLQAVSGAGYPGIASLDILGNVVPYIAGEEEKIEQETRRILGIADVVATATRVPVLEGHTACVSVNLRRPADARELADVLRTFSGEPQRLALPSAPRHPVVLRSECDRPQPRLDVGAGNGMSTVVGRIRVRERSVQFVALGHNTIRGAAGAALLNAELVAVRTNLVSRCAVQAVTGTQPPP